MNVTTVLTGMWPFAILVAAFLTAVSSAFLLWLYRRVTLRGMERLIGKVVVSSLPGEGRKTATVNSLPLTIQSQPGKTFCTTSAAVKTAYDSTVHSLRVVAVIYAASGLVYALILATPWMLMTSNGFPLRRLLWLVACYAWPIVLTVSLVAATTPGTRYTIGGGYFALVSMIALDVLVHNPGLSISELVFFWLFANAAGTVLLLAFLHRRVRAVGPLVLTFMVAGVMGAFVPIEVARNNEGVLRVIVAVGQPLGLGATALFVLMHVVGFAVLGVLGWWLLGLIGRYYRAKRLSDQSLTIDSLWLLFGVVQPITLAFEGWGWICTGLVAFASYKLATLAGFALWQGRTARANHAPMLLLLRVFALGRRSEQFFDAFSTWWRRAGSISLIAGPDLLTTVVEPHEFLAFVSGQVSRQFVQSAADLERRLAELDRQPDPDGRVRVNEFFCHADTWQMTMRRLAQESDAVLMDLRSFARANQGCLYELEQLLDIVDLERVVFLVDHTTDRPFLEETLQHLWQRVDRASPNRTAGAPTVHLFQASSPPGRSIRALLPLLLGGERDIQGRH